MNPEPLSVAARTLANDAGSPPTPETASTAAAGAQQTLEPEQIEELRQKIVEALKTCYDPEIPVNIYELGLIYNIDISPAGAVHIRMTLTSPMCPAVGSLPPDVQAKVQAIPGVASAKVEVVWAPPWDKSMMSEEAAVELGLY